MYGQHGQMNVAEVPRQCPPLLSHKAMEELGMVLDFENLTTSIRSAGVIDKPMLRADSGHPILKITDYDSEKTFPDRFLTHFAEDEYPDGEDEPSEPSEDESAWAELKKGAKKRLNRRIKSLDDVFR